MVENGVGDLKYPQQETEEKVLKLFEMKQCTFFL
jgi:hypothetical protein